MTLLLPSCFSDEPNQGFTFGCEEGFYQLLVSRGTAERGLETTGKLATLSPKRQQHGAPSLAASQPISSPKLCRGTLDRPHTTAAETRTLGLIHSSSVPREGFHIHQNIFICHRFQVPLGVVFVSVLRSLMTSAFHKHKHTCFS